MKISKPLLLLVCFFAGLLPLNAQFFQHSYGDVSAGPPGDIDRLDDGRRTFGAMNGMMLTGTNLQIGGPGVPRWADVFVTNLDGRVGVPQTIALGYGMQDFAGVTMYPYSCFGAEVRASEYAIAGVCDVSPGSAREIFYAQLNSVGTILASNTFSLGAGYDRYLIREMVPDQTGNFVYIVGEVTEMASGLNYVFAMKIKYNAGIDWSHLYEIDPSSSYEDFAWDAVEVAATNELAVVGRTLDPFTGTQGGYLFVLDANTGLPSGSFPDMTLFSHNGGPTELTSVVHVQDPAFPSGNGFVMAGHSGAGIGDPVAFGIDYTLNPSTGFGTTFTGPLTSYNSVINDISTRVNTGGNNEYYVVGTTTAGFVGGSDIEVFKLDNFLNPVNQFVFGTVADEEGKAVDVGNGGSGLITFGSRDHTGSTWDMLTIKSYYNGVLPTGCNVVVNGCGVGSAPLFNQQPMGPPVGVVFSQTLGSLFIAAQMADRQWCHSPSVVGGSNWKAAAESLKDAVQVVGNPTDGYTLEVSFDGSAEKAMELSITDMMGRTVWTHSAQVQPGGNELRLPDGSNWAAGMYQVKWTLDGANGAEKMVVE